MRPHSKQSHSDRPTEHKHKNTRTLSPFLPAKHAIHQRSCVSPHFCLFTPFHSERVFYSYPTTLHISLLGQLPSVGYVVGVGGGIIIDRACMQALVRRLDNLTASFLSCHWRRLARTVDLDRTIDPATVLSNQLRWIKNEKIQTPTGG